MVRVEMIPKQVLKNPLATQKRSPNIQLPSLLKSMTKENGRHRTAVRKSDNDNDMMKALVTVRSCLCLTMTIMTVELPRLDRRKMERRTRACAATMKPCRTELLSVLLSTDNGRTSWTPLRGFLLWSWYRFLAVPTVVSVVVVVTRRVTMETTLKTIKERNVIKYLGFNTCYTNYCVTCVKAILVSITYLPKDKYTQLRNMCSLFYFLFQIIKIRVSQK